MPSLKSTFLKPGFYILWCGTLILQAIFTELSSDEAYYWVFSNHLAWGYFDHPPGIAFFIHIGNLFFGGELGVRILSIASSAMMIYIMERIIRPDNLFLYYLLVASVGILHFIGFLAIPDAPLMLLAALMLLVYKRYLQKPELLNAVLLGIVMAALVLSKYHGGIFILLILISNLGLLKRSSFWIAILVSFTVVLPHLIWQAYEGFPSFTFHLGERSPEGFRIRYPLEYLATQPFILGPFTGVIFLIAAYKIKSRDQFEKSLKFVFWGCYLFFLILAFKVRVEGHWTLFAVLPGLYFGYRYVERSARLQKAMIYLGAISLVLVAVARITILVDINPDSALWKITRDFHHEDKMLAIKEKAGPYPVAFMNSYQSASLYQFYTGTESFSMNNIMGRLNQYDIWHPESNFQGQSIMLVNNHFTTQRDSVQFGDDKIFINFIDDFRYLPPMKVELLDEVPVVKPGESFKLHIRILFPAGLDWNPDENSNGKYYAGYYILDEKIPVKEKHLVEITADSRNFEMEVVVEVPDEPGNYKLGFSGYSGDFPASRLSRKFNLKVRK